MSLQIKSLDAKILVVEYLLQHKSCTEQRAKDRVLEKLRYHYKKLLAEEGLPITTECVVKLQGDYCDVIAKVVA
jgi:hypothetical protein